MLVIGITLVTDASQIIHNPAVDVLLAPMVLNTANNSGISPAPLSKVSHIFSSVCFLIRVRHYANILVMSDGGN